MQDMLVAMLVWYVFVGIAKALLVVVSLPYAATVYNRRHRVSHSTFVWYLILLPVTATISVVTWPYLLYREGGAFFLLYHKRSVLREVLAQLKAAHDYRTS